LIAVHCKTEEEWHKVRQKYGRHHSDTGWRQYAEQTCVCHAGFHCKQHYEEKGYTIISSEEYLKEGENEVSEFKVGDRVECIDIGNSSAQARLEVGKLYTIRSFCKHSDNFYLKETGYNYPPRKFKLATNKPTIKTTKEETMNINDNVLEVFKEDAVLAGKVAKRFGSQYGTTDRDTIALKRDKKELLAIIKADEEEAAKDK
jgi:hypothetical protein